MLVCTNHNEEIFMKRISLFITGLALIAWGLAGCANMNQSGSTMLVDGTNMDQWSPIGNANWRVADGSIQADKGNGFLVSKNSYTDFEIRAEFWVDATANSGIFLRCADRTKVTAENAYEVNIFDQRPDPSYGTGAIVNVAKIGNMIKAGGQWNTYEIVAKGPVFTVTLNGVRTVDGARDSRLASGPIALQYAAGVVKFRKLEIKPL
jgi:Domain of Unknown Function (DUF1080)